MSDHLAPSTFILGAARSGTSLLYEALCLHPEAAYFNNWMRRMPRVPALTVTNRVARHTPRTRRRVWFGSDSNAYAYARSRSLAERLYPMPVEGEPVFAACGIGEEAGAPTAAQIRALRRAVAGAVRWSGGTHFINKRVANNRRVELLAQAFPRARFVDLTRDGRAVALSLSRVDWWETSIVWWYGGTPRAWREAGGDPWELCARNWVEEVRAIDAGLATVGSDRVLHLTYEGFIAEPRDSLRRVAGFMGMADDRRWLEAVDSLTFPNRNRRWTDQLTPESLATIETVQAAELERRGYR
ncbi:MAG: sulfotransferase family protein [Candidatus Dormibacteria bacterium]